MITARDLDEAIAECMGQRNPNTSTCVKLAAYMIIKDHLYPPETTVPGHSYASGDDSVDSVEMGYDSGTELSEAVRGLSMREVMPVFDELMDALKILNLTLYNATIRKLREL